MTSPTNPSDEEKWYYFWNEQKKGPVSREEIEQMLQRGEISSYTMVWHAGLPDWVPAAQGGFQSVLATEDGSMGERFKKSTIRIAVFTLITICVIILVFAGMDQILSSISASEKKRPPISAWLVSKKAMPLNRETHEEYMDQVYALALVNSPFGPAMAEFSSQDLTQLVKPLSDFKEDKRFPQSSTHRHIITKMGYDYEATIAEIAQHKNTLEGKLFGQVFIGIAKSAFGEAKQLLDAGVISKSTAEALERAFGERYPNAHFPRASDVKKLETVPVQEVAKQTAPDAPQTSNASSVHLQEVQGQVDAAKAELSQLRGEITTLAREQEKARSKVEAPTGAQVVGDGKENAYASPERDEGTFSAMISPVYRRYENSRFAYTVLYPENLLFPDQGNKNEGGCRLVSNDSRIEVEVFGEPNRRGGSLEALYRRKQQEHNGAARTVTYKTIKADWFVISGFENDKVFYDKVLLRDGVLKVLTIRYDKVLDEPLTPIVGQISKSFKNL